MNHIIKYIFWFKTCLFDLGRIERVFRNNTGKLASMIFVLLMISLFISQEQLLFLELKSIVNMPRQWPYSYCSFQSRKNNTNSGGFHVLGVWYVSAFFSRNGKTLVCENERRIYWRYLPSKALTFIHLLDKKWISGM